MQEYYLDGGDNKTTPKFYRNVNSSVYNGVDIGKVYFNKNLLWTAPKKKWAIIDTHKLANINTKPFFIDSNCFGFNFLPVLHRLSEDYNVTHQDSEYAIYAKDGILYSNADAAYFDIFDNLSFALGWNNLNRATTYQKIDFNNSKITLNRVHNRPDLFYNTFRNYPFFDFNCDDCQPLIKNGRYLSNTFADVHYIFEKSFRNLFENSNIFYFENVFRRAGRKMGGGFCFETINYSNMHINYMIETFADSNVLSLGSGFFKEGILYQRTFNNSTYREGEWNLGASAYLFKNYFLSSPHGDDFHLYETFHNCKNMRYAIIGFPNTPYSLSGSPYSGCDNIQYINVSNGMNIKSLGSLIDWGIGRECNLKTNNLIINLSEPNLESLNSFLSYYAYYKDFKHINILFDPKNQNCLNGIKYLNYFAYSFPGGIGFRYFNGYYSFFQNNLEDVNWAFCEANIIKMPGINEASVYQIPFNNDNYCFCPKIKEMWQTYAYCSNLVEVALCYSGLEGLDSTLRNCSNLIKLYSYYGMYSVVGGQNLNWLYTPFDNCYNLGGNIYFPSKNISSFYMGDLGGKNHVRPLNIFIYSNTKTNNSLFRNNSNYWNVWDNNLGYGNVQDNIFVYYADKDSDFLNAKQRGLIG